ncbi:MULTISPECIES: carbohydrate ABC transporter permease [Actinomyces]|uniref:Carbohydrate ABC transporter permease n=1 Tax=Actinomyces marmotae TaxID=2737173 RepID=A0A6M8AZT6_9ACTO|nr:MULTISPECIES: carbohydrate ABC transporter permease [Actinomyces]QKD80119.1 carbohydrate ABC transporter permease [Actinomyces marmotae]
MTTTSSARPATTHVGADPAAAYKVRRRSRAAFGGTNWWTTLLVVVLSLTILVPLYFTIITAFKTPAELAASGWALPEHWRIDNFAQAWEMTSYPRRVLTSTIITLGATVLTIVSNSMVAYALGRNMHRRWVRWMYYYVVAALFVPFPIIMLPVVRETAMLHLDNEAGLILLYVVYGLAFNILMYTSFIKAIPEELEEAAAIDGASRWGIFWRIIFPLLSPMNATVGILTCLWAWNDFLLPLVILTDQSKATLPLAQYVFQGQFNTNYPVSFASYLMAIAPMFVVYVLAQRWVISGVMRGAQK